MAQRGPKAKPKLEPRELLRPEPPTELKLSDEAVAVYRELAERLATEGFASQADARTVGITARTVALVDRIEAEIDQLDELTITTDKGQVKPHPLIGMLRAEKSKLADLLGALLLTPRSRSSVRLTEAQMRGAARSKPQESKLGKFASKKKG